MTPGSVSRRYARALYQLATEERAGEAVGGGLKEVASAIEQLGVEQVSEGVLELDARRAIGETLASKVGKDTTLGKFLLLVAERDRIARLPEIARRYARMEDDAAGRVQLSITTAGELAEPEIAAIRDAFRPVAKREIVTHVTTDPSLLGGAVVELDGRVYDGSIRTALARLASRMAGSTNGSSAAGNEERKGKGNADQSV
jgi:F-type H+-transporting ATPase subunit delta